MTTTEGRPDALPCDTSWRHLEGRTRRARHLAVAGAFQSAYLGYYGMAWRAGRGLMTETVDLAVPFAVDLWGLHRVEANIQPGNLRSIALARRLGLRREGLSPRYLRVGGAWCDHERWARLAD